MPNFGAATGAAPVSAVQNKLLVVAATCSTYSAALSTAAALRFGTKSQTSLEKCNTKKVVMKRIEDTINCKKNLASRTSISREKREMVKVISRARNLRDWTL